MTVTRGSKHRKISQATMRGLTGDLLSEIEALKSEAETAQKKKIGFEFKTGQKYIIKDTDNTKITYISDYIFVYQCKQGKHHFFKHWQAGYTITFTDPQLIGKFIQEVDP